MVGLWKSGEVLEVVTNRQDEILIAIAVEIGRHEPGTAEVEIGGSPQHAGTKLPVTEALEAPEFLVILRDHGSNIRVTIAIEVGHRHMDTTRRTVQQMIGEATAWLLLEPKNLTATVAEDSHRQIDITVSVEVARLHVRDPADVVEQHLTDIAGAHSSVKLNPTHRRVGGHDVTENSHDTVEVGIAVDVDERRMGGNADIGDQHGFPPRTIAVSIKTNDPVTEGIASDDFRDAVEIHVDDLDVRDSRKPLGGFRGDRLRKSELARGERNPFPGNKCRVGRNPHPEQTAEPDSETSGHYPQHARVDRHRIRFQEKNSFHLYPTEPVPFQDTTSDRHSTADRSTRFEVAKQPEGP